MLLQMISRELRSPRANLTLPNGLHLRLRTFDVDAHTVDAADGSLLQVCVLHRKL